MGLSVGAIGLDLKVNGGNLRKQITRETQSAAMSAEGILGNSFTPVSYTHIDVYKRKGLYS